MILSLQVQGDIPEASVIADLFSPVGLIRIKQTDMQVLRCLLM